MRFARHINSAATAGNLSTVHRGNAFEERCLKVLQDDLSMSLRRVGGKSDGGVDLQGWWWLPPTLDLGANASDIAAPKESLAGRRRLRVFAQCKAEKKKFSPNYVREMEGVLHRYLSSSKMNLGNDSGDIVCPLVALLLSESPFTTSTFLRAQSSPVPFFLLHLPPVTFEAEASDADCEEVLRKGIGTAFWNPALGGERGILGGHIEARWERATGGRGRPGLWCLGKKIQNWTPDGGIPELDDSFEVPGY